MATANCKDSAGYLLSTEGSLFCADNSRWQIYTYVDLGGPNCDCSPFRSMGWCWTDWHLSLTDNHWQCLPFSKLTDLWGNFFNCWISSLLTSLTEFIVFSSECFSCFLFVLFSFTFISLWSRVVFGPWAFMSNPLLLYCSNCVLITPYNSFIALYIYNHHM